MFVSMTSKVILFEKLSYILPTRINIDPKFKEINFLFVCIIVFGGLSLIQVKTNGLISFLSKISFEMYLVQSIAIGIVSILYWGHIFWYCLLVIILDIVLAIILSKYSAIMKGYLMERSMMGGKKI